ncbi:MAG: hypothetical protein JWO63_800 [Frankiales bacterium]|nr:hypothetical protein [Frankiales bacterium]
MTESAASTAPAEKTAAALDQIAAAVAAIEDVDELPLIEAAQRFHGLHDELQGALSDLDRG